MKVRVLRSWDGIPVGEILDLEEKPAYSAVLQGRAEYVQEGEEFVELRLLKEWQGLSPGTVIQRTKGVASTLTLGFIAELVSPPPPDDQRAEPDDNVPVDDEQPDVSADGIDVTTGPGSADAEVEAVEESGESANAGSDEGQTPETDPPAEEPEAQANGAVEAEQAETDPPAKEDVPQVPAPKPQAEKPAATPKPKPKAEKPKGK